MVGSSNARIGTVDIVSWGGGTYKQISKMLDAHYKGTIDISDYWEVGDIRQELLYDVIGRSGVSNTSDYDLPFLGSEIVELIIIGFNHDDLVRSINGITKAAVTVHWVNPFSKNLSIGQIMDTGTTDNNPWETRALRGYVNNNIYNAIPEGMADLIKYVKKKSNTYSSSSVSADKTQQVNTTDRVFLLSTYEVYGENMFTEDYVTTSVVSSGNQYDYFQTGNNKIKYIDTTAINWVLREILYNKSTREPVCVCSNGSAGYANNSLGLAPAFCL